MIARSLRITALAALLCSIAGVAHADLGPAPRCPDGQRSAYDQGRYCAPVRCETDEECTGGSVCAARGLCLAQRGGSGRSYQVAGECNEQSDCVAPATCVRELFCGSAVPEDERLRRPEPREATPNAETNAAPSAETNAAPSAETNAAPSAETNAAPNGDTNAAPNGESNARPNEGCASRGCTVAGAGSNRTAFFISALVVGMLVRRRARR